MLPSQFQCTTIIQNIYGFIGTTCFIIALPFGFSSALENCFSKTIKPIIAYLCSRAIWFVIFLDDNAVLGDSIEECTKNVKQVIDLLKAMGFVINHEKSNFTPRQIALYIGYILLICVLRRYLFLL